MATYENCYSMLGDVRLGLNEYSTTRHQGSSTSGVYNNGWLVQRINDAQRQIYNLLMNRAPEKFLTSADLSISSSAATLPWNCGTIAEMKDENGYKVYPSSISVLPVDGVSGSDRLYYEHANNTVTLNKSGVTETYKLWFYIKPRDLIQGKCVTDDTLDDATYPGKAIADYYNSMILESITGDWAALVTDYSAARVITCTSTLSTDDYYGFVSEIPETFHNLIVPRAVQLAKALHPRSQEKPTVTEINLWRDQLQDAIIAWAGMAADVSQEEIWTNMGGGVIGGAYLPDQGYLM